MAGPARDFRMEFGRAVTSDPLTQLAPAERDLVRQRLSAEFEATLRARDGERTRQQEEQAVAFTEALAASLEAEAQAVLQSVALAAAEVALTVAERIVRREVAADPTVLGRALEDLLLRLRAGAPVTVTVHPEDAAWLEAQPELRARLRIAAVQPDRRVARGGCLATADRQEWDATLDGQLAVLGEAIEAALAGAAGPEGGAPVVSAPPLA